MAKPKKASLNSKTSSPEKSHMPYILLVEDEPTHAAIIRHTIKSVNPNAVVKEAGSLEEYRNIIAKSLPEIVLIDMLLPDGKALDVLASPPETGLFPIVVMTSSDDEKMAVKAMKAGALDYVIKSTEAYKAMPHTIERALREWKLIQERKKAEEELRESEFRFRTLYENIVVGLYRTTPAGKILLANRALVQMLGYSSFEKLAERNLTKVGFAQSSERKKFLKEIETAGEVNDFESAWARQDGSVVFVRENARAFRDSQGKTLYYDGSVEDITERRLAELASRHAEDALWESEEKLRSIAENSHDVLFITDAKGIVAYISSAVNAVFGYKSGEMTGHFFGEYLDATELPRILPIFEDAIRTGIPTKNLSFLAKRKDGKIFNAELDTSVIIKNGKVEGTTGVIRDISESRQAEEALRNSEEKFRKAFMTSPDSININRLIDGMYVSINQSFTRITGYSEKDIIGKTSIEKNIWVDPADRNKLVEGLKKDGVVENLVARFRSKNGEIKYGMMSASIIELGGIQHILSITRDITERRQIEETLNTSEEKYRSIFENVQDVYYETSFDGTILEISPSIRLISKGQYCQTDLIGTSMYDFYAEVKDRDVLLAAIQKTGSVTDFEVQLKNRDGLLIYCSISSKIIFDADGRPNKIIGSMHDITERKQAGEALRESEERFEKFMANLPAVVFMKDHESRLLFANQKLKDLLGWQDAIGKLTSELLPPELAQKMIADDKRVIDKGPEIVHEKIKGVNGTEYFFETHKFPFYKKNGEILIGGISIDETERKRAEEQLTQSRDLLANLSRLVPGVIYQYRLYPDGHSAFPYSSPGMNDIYEVTPEEVREDATPVFGRLHPDDYDNVANAIDESAKTLQEFYCEFRVILPRQGLRWRWSQAHPERMEDGGTLWHGVISDITERKLAEEALRESEERFSILSDAAFEGIVVTDKGRIVDVNEQLTAMFGYRRTEMLDLTVEQFVAPESLELVLQHIQLGSEDSYEHLALRKDGSIFPVEIRAKSLPYKGGVVRVTAIRDITERKRSEEALHESEERMRAIVEGTPHLFFYKQDIDANNTYVSPTVEKITGYKTDIWLKRKDWFITAAKLNQDAKEKTFAHLRGEFSEEPILLEVCHANGNPILLEAYEYPIMQNGKVIGLQGVAHDITERRLADEALRQMQKLDGLGTLAGGIAHDFNNILGIILAYTANIKRLKNDTKQLDLATDTIMKAVDRGKTLVSQILTFARKSGTEFGPVNVTEVVMEIMTMIFETFPKVLTYSQNIDMDIPYINADRSQLHQALLNLCVNARDSMPNGGVLTINTRMVPGTSLHNLHQDALADKYVCIEVSDTGEGMVDEVRKRIFEPFFTTKEKGKGTGLGLAVVFGIVQTHKGFIDVESELGKGTTFRLYIPVSQAAVPISIEVGETIEEISGGKETLLVVEDELNLRIPLLKILSEKGYTVLSAEDGLAGMKIYEERNNDITLVITDLGLPKMSGMDLCKRIKQLNPSARIVIATGYLAPETKLEFHKAGIQNIVYKPYDIKKVLKMVREVLDEK